MRQRRAARYGLSIAFDSRPDELELTRLVESTVWVNEAHPGISAFLVRWGAAFERRKPRSRR
jgi:hypothetical protein